MSPVYVPTRYNLVLQRWRVELGNVGRLCPDLDFFLEGNLPISIHRDPDDFESIFDGP